MKIVRTVLGAVLAAGLVVGLGVSGSPALVGSAAADVTDRATPAAGAPRTATTAKPTRSKSHAKTVHYPKAGQTSAKVYELQQRLVLDKVLKTTQLTGHFSRSTVKAVRKFQRSRLISATGRVNQRTWTDLVASTGARPALKVSTLDRRCQVTARAICVDKTLRKLYYVKNGRVRQIMDARFGCRVTPTRMGLFHIQRKSRYHTSSIFHVYMPNAMFFNGGQAVHWSAAFTKHGYHGCSHGCVNIRDKAGVRALFDTMHVRDRVVVYRS
jgi:peptidoglycan hydrolase-like protein with peptidoglycan-binding domain